MGVMHYRGAFAIITVFDMTQPETFETAKYWLEEVQDKRDMSKQRAVSTSEAMRDAVRHGATYIKTTANHVDREVDNVQVSLPLVFLCAAAARTCPIAAAL